MPKKQRQTFVERLPPNFYEWDAVLNEGTTIKGLKVIAEKTLVVSGSNTRRIFRGIFKLLTVACPHWTFTKLVKVGHMASRYSYRSKKSSDNRIS